MGAAGAVEVLFRKEIAGSTNQEQATTIKVEEYENKFLNPSRAMERGYVDAVIAPSDTRAKLYRHLKSHFNKVEDYPDKRNGNIPT